MNVMMMEIKTGSKIFLNEPESRLKKPEPKRVIGLCGYAQVGKTTTAIQMLSSLRLAGSGEIVPFAGPVKDIARLFGWDGQKDERGRKLLQQIGTEVGRNYDPDIWVNKWSNIVLSRLEMFVPIIIADDVRFQNEIERIHWLDGVVIKIRCPKRELRLDHSSEKADTLKVDHELQVGEDVPPEVVARNVLKLAGWY
jgi:hypothetical protein